MNQLLGTRHDLNVINGHAQHWRLEPANRASGLFGSDRIAGAANLGGTVNLSMGCHAGLSVCDGDSADAAAALDFPQAFAAKGASFVGNTGYGYGDTVAVALTEDLLRRFVRELGRAPGVSLGTALARAKQDYALDNLGFYGPYDEKVLAEATLYGFPMATVTMPKPGAYELAWLGGEIEPQPGLELSTLPSSAAPAAVVSRTVTMTPALTAVNTAQGVYYTGDGGVQAVLYRPLQPRASVDIVQPGAARARGALFLAGKYHDLSGFDPVITMPVTDTAR